MPFVVDTNNTPIFINNPSDSDKIFPLLLVRLNNTSYGNNWSGTTGFNAGNMSLTTLSALNVPNNYNYVLIQFYKHDGYEHGQFEVRFSTGSIYLNATGSDKMVAIWFDSDFPPNGRLMYCIWTGTTQTTGWTDAPTNASQSPSNISVGGASLYESEYSYDRSGVVRHV